jgi:hypothetical protein
MSIKNAIVALRISSVFILLNTAVALANPLVKINPCQLISQMEAEEIMGEKMKASKLQEQKATGMKLCLYEAADDKSFAMLQVSILQGKIAKETYSIIKNNFPDHEMIDQFGEDAFIATPGIHILDNGYYLTIAAGNLNQNRDRVMLAGKRAVANLEIKLK